jgi:serine protease Do
MKFSTTGAALTVLAAAIGTALFAQISGVHADEIASSITPAPALQVQQVDALYRVEAEALPAPAAIGSSGMALPDFRTIVRENSDSVVKIEVSENGKSIGQGESESEAERDPMQDFFERFGGGPRGQQAPRQGMGSGFIVGENGRILTNAHVVKGADEVIVRLNDQREFKAKVMGLDERTDVAVLKIEASGLPVVKLGQSDKVEVGEWVLAIGAPFGLDYSATQGIVSATGRELPNDNFVPFIQTDAAVNPGNSGGPLFNVRGEVIGINSQIFSRSGGYMGLSFAIPIKTVIGVAQQLEKKGFVERGWLGVAIQTMNPAMARNFGLDRPTGALVGDVSPNSPALAAGLRSGDVIMAFNGEKVKNSADLPPMVAATPVDEKAVLDVLRDGKRQSITVKVGRLKEDRAVAAGPAEVEQSSALDLTVSDLTPDQRDQMGISQGGVVITDIRPGPASRAGVQRGDVILEVNRQKIPSADKFSEIVKTQGKRDSTLLLLKRQGSSLFVVVENAS